MKHQNQIKFWQDCYDRRKKQYQMLRRSWALIYNQLEFFKYNTPEYREIRDLYDTQKRWAGEQYEKLVHAEKMLKYLKERKTREQLQASYNSTLESTHGGSLLRDRRAETNI